MYSERHFDALFGIYVQNTLAVPLKSVFQIAQVEIQNEKKTAAKFFENIEISHFIEVTTFPEVSFSPQI